MPEVGSDCYEWGVEYHGGGLESPLVTGVISPARCQELCQGREGCLYFTWVSSQHNVLNYRNTCWLKGGQGTPQPCQSCVSGPRQCEDTSTTTTPSTGCCSTVTVASSGDTVDYQWTRLGVFTLVDISPDGRPVYMKSGSSPQFLYYLEWLGVWYVGDDPLVNMGGLINWGDSVCPSDLQDPWSFYRWGDGEINDWDEDPLLTVTCGGRTTSKRTTDTTTPRPTTTTTSLVGTCSSGSECEGCSVWTEEGGVRYCCAAHCDQGDVWVWQEDGETRCACSP